MDDNMLVEKPLSENSTFRISNTFSELGVFGNIHSYRLTLTALAQYDFDFPELEKADEREMHKYFSLAQANEPDALKVRLSIKDTFAAWKVNSPYRARQHIAEHISKNLLTCHINGEDELIPLFSSISNKLIDGDYLDLWFNHRSMPYLINAHLDTSGFITAIPIKYFHGLRSVMTMKLYEKMLRFIDTGQVIFTPESLRTHTGTNSKDYFALKRNVINKAKAEIEKMEHVNSFQIIEEKCGRKVKVIKIKFSMPKISTLKRKNKQRNIEHNETNPT